MGTRGRGRWRRGLGVVLSAALLVALAPAAGADPGGPAGPGDPTGSVPGRRAPLTVTAGAPLDTVLRALDTAVASDDALPGDHLADRLLVTWREGTTPAEAAAVLADLDVGGHGLTEGFTVQVVAVDRTTAAHVVTALHGDPRVEAVVPDVQVAMTPSTLHPLQWGLRNTGQILLDAEGGMAIGRPGIDVGAVPAWQVTTGSAQVVVAIVDTGLDITHPDLAANVWVNPGECCAPDGVDDDGNGFVDDLHGWNFVDDTPQVFDPDNRRPADPATGRPERHADEHGTHVAGIVAAAANDAGVIGVAPGVRVMSVKALEDGSGAVGNVIAGIQYAVANGADVVNLSLGFRRARTSADVAALRTTVAQAGVAMVAAAGNEGRDPTTGTFPEWPAALDLPNVIAVAAHDNRGRLPTFSNWSADAVDVAAPGALVVSTIPLTSGGSGLAFLSGTSQAAPHVSGLLALAISHTGRNDGAELAQALRAGARPFGPLVEPGSARRPGSMTRSGIASGPGLLAALGADLGACRGGAPAAGFADVAAAGAHAANIDCVIHRGLASGYPDGSYQPQTVVNRAQMASFLAGLVRTVKPLPAGAPGRFRDVSSGPHVANIEALADLGIIGGFTDGTYRPSAPVTREQVASLLLRTYEHLVQGEVRPHLPAPADTRGSTHETNVRKGMQVGFVQGRVDGSFAPRDGVTRAQLASFLRRALDKLVNDRVADLGP